jgi:ribulose-phosphate 3-epimerase
VLTDDPGEARDLIEKVEKSGKFGRVQVDFVDGEYNTNLTILPGDILVSEFSGLKFDAHLMVVQKNIGRWANEAEVAGYDRIVAQVESISEPGSFSGLALDVHSPIGAIEPYLGHLEVVVVMAIEPGFGGQEFCDEVIKSIKRLREIRDKFEYKFRICVDGGIQKEHLDELEKAGADEVAVGARRVMEW